jgi:hypothetical protein
MSSLTELFYPRQVEKSRKIGSGTSESLAAPFDDGISRCPLTSSEVPQFAAFWQQFRTF